MTNITSQIKALAMAIGLQLISTLPAAAQNFTLSPMVTISTAQGGRSRGSINVTNNASEPVRMRVYAESFTYDRKQGFVSIPKDDRSAVPYINFSPRELVIQPGITRNVRVAVTLPPSLPNQEYRAAVFVEELKAKDTQSTNILVNNKKLSISLRVASVFFFNKSIEGFANIQARMVAWNPISKKVTMFVENTGKQTARPDVSWQIEKNGQIVAQDKINGVIIQAENSREVILQIKDKLPDLSRGEYKVVGDIVNTGQKPIAFSLNVIVP